MTQEEFESFKAVLKRRGFIYPTAEIYGGTGNLFDFGTLGAILKIRFKNFFLKRFISSRDDMELLDGAIIMNRRVWQASGHEESFNDLLLECPKCKSRFKADEFLEKESILGKQERLNCPICETLLSSPRAFNTMFKTFLGPAEDSASLTYLRPETAQNIFVNFKNILQSYRRKIPFGIAQIGKAFRNEITPGDFLFRIREFEQCEIEYFIYPSREKEEKSFEKWFKDWWQFFIDLGISEKNLVAYDHPKEKLAHYSRGTRDINYRFPFGLKELAGVAKRGDFDLKRHQEFSKSDLSFFDEASGSRFLPWVIEPTLGIERAIFAILLDAYKEYPGGRARVEEKEKDGEFSRETSELEVVLHLKPFLAPYQVAILPLVKKPALVELSQRLTQDLKEHFFVFYDEVGSIGRRYRRQDEIGTPFAVTIDFQTIEDKSVTIRDRDTMKQIRVALDKVAEFLKVNLKSS